MSDYAGAPRERLVQINTADVAGPPAPTDAPHIVLSPRSSRGLPTAGLALVLLGFPTPNGVDYGTPAIATAPGFTVTLYRALPTAAGGWGALTPITGVNYNDLLTLPDISGPFALRYVLTNVATPGVLLVGLTELD